jgi:hypothetical protein
LGDGDSVNGLATTGGSNYFTVNSSKGTVTGQFITGTGGSSLLYLDTFSLRSASIGVADNFEATLSSSNNTLIHKFAVQNNQTILTYDGIPYAIFRSVSVPSSIFEIYSTTKGSRPFPLMTTAQRDAIVSPVIGLMVYVTDGTETEGIYVRKSTGWTLVA